MSNDDKLAWFHAIDANKTEDVEKMISAFEFDIDFLGFEGFSGLHYAARKGHVVILKLLYRHGASVNILNRQASSSPLICSVHCGKFEVLRVLLEELYVDLSHGGTSTQHTALMTATAENQVAYVIALLCAGSDVDAVNVRGWNSLHGACFYNYKRAAQCLIQHGIYINAKTQTGRTAISLARMNRHFELADFVAQYSSVQRQTNRRAE